MKKIFKSAFALILTMLIVIPLCALPMAAITTNDEIVDSYIYDFYATPVEAPVAYAHIKTLSAEDVGADILTYEPVDLFERNGYVYVLDRGGNQIIVLDENYTVKHTIRSLKNTPATADAPGYVIPELDKNKYDALGNPSIDPEMTAANAYSFNQPSGIYVTEDGLIYVADTQNRRIVVCDINGYVKQVYQSVKVSILGKSYIFKPLKLVVDRAGGMQVIAYAVNRGIMELDNTGMFTNFVGAPKVEMNPMDWFWRMLATDEQRKKLVTYVPTEYNNIAQDYRGFMYVTISTIDSESLVSAATSLSEPDTAPVSKLNTSGIDILRRNGIFPVIGDLDFTIETTPQIVDADSYDNGCFIILDQRSGRFFVYDNDCNLIFISGGKGSQQGRTSTPYSLVINGDHVVISDVGTKSIVVYEMTDYAKTVFNALDSHIAGEYDVSSEYWKDVIAYNSNMYIAYIGLGKAEMRTAMTLYYDDTRLDHYQNALDYFEVANETTYYSQAFKELQRASMEENFALIAISAIVLVIGLFVLYFLVKTRKSKRRKKKGGRR